MSQRLHDMFQVAKKNPGAVLGWIGTLAVFVGASIFNNQRGVEANQRMNEKTNALIENRKEKTDANFKTLRDMINGVQLELKSVQFELNGIQSDLKSHEMSISQLLRDAATDRNLLRSQLRSIQDQMVLTEVVRIRKTVDDQSVHTEAAKN